MKFILPVLLLLCGTVLAQKSHVKVSPGEYETVALRHDSAFDMTQGKPIFIMKNIMFVAAGPHDYILVDSQGIVHPAGGNNAGELGTGNTTGLSTPGTVTTDVNGAALPFIVQVSMGATNFGGFWNSALVGSDGSVYVAGNTQGGNLGNGTAGAATTTKFTKVTFPGGVRIVKVLAGLMMVALDDQGNVWDWGANGDQYSLGQGTSSPTFMIPTKITAYSNIVDICGGRKYMYALRNDGHVFATGGQFYVQYTGMFPTFSQFPNTPTDITSLLALPATISKINCNDESTYVILTDGTLWAWGGNANGTIGNGQEIVYTLYCGFPTPYGSGGNPANCTQQFPYAWDQGVNELQVLHPYHVMSGLSAFTDIFVTNTLCFEIYVEDINNNLYAWGRNKIAICFGITDANPSNGNIQSQYPNSWDLKYPKAIDPWAVTTVWQVTSPFCILNPSGFPCNIYTVPSHTPPTASLVVHNLGGGVVVLDNTASHDNRFIMKRVMTQTAGASLNLGAQDNALDTVRGVAGGSYTVQVSIINDNWDSTIAINTFTVGTGVPPTVSAGSNQQFSLPQTSTTLVGTASGNAGATIVSTIWTQTGGPPATIVSPNNSLTTAITGLTTSSTSTVYTFQLSATDNNNATSSATVTITVLPAPTNIIQHRIPRNRVYIRI